MVTVTARDISRNATVQFKILEPAQIVDLVGTRHWEYLVRETNRTASGTTSDGMEVRFKVIGVGMGVTLGPFFGLAERQGYPIILKIFEALGKYQIVGCSVGDW